MLISMVIEGMLTIPGANTAIILKEKGGQRRAMLFFSRAFVPDLYASIASQTVTGTPIRHALAMNVFAELGGMIHHLAIPEFVGERYRTILHIQQGNRDIAQEMMPSDALSFAACSRCPILMDEKLLNEASQEAQDLLENTMVATEQSSIGEAAAHAIALPENKLPRA